MGGIALIGWRVERRLGARGVAVFTSIVCVAGPMRDFSVAAILPQVIHIGPLPFSLIADVGAWGGVVFVALAVMRLVAGPASADRFRRAPAR